MNNFNLEMEEVPKNHHHGLWVEAYRPKNLSEFIGSDDLKETLQIWIKNKEIPHIFFYGPPGTGKTSLSKMLVNEIPCDLLFINASDENSVDVMRTKVQDFSMSIGINNLKIVVLDECDRISDSGQCLLRNLTETYSDTTRFILTANYQEKVIPAIKSRMQSFEIKPPSKAKIMEHIVKILKNENIKFEPKDVANIINSYFPDLRKIINFCHQSSVTKELKIVKENAIDSDYKTKLVELLKNHNKAGIFDEIRQMVADASFSNYEEVYKFLFAHVNEFAGKSAPEAILCIADGLYQSALVFEREITFVATMHKILNALK